MTRALRTRHVHTYASAHTKCADSQKCAVLCDKTRTFRQRQRHRDIHREGGRGRERPGTSECV